MSIEVREDVLFKGNSGDSLRKRSFHHVKGDDNHRTHCVPPMSIKAWHCWFYCQTHCHIHPHKQQMRQYEENIAKLQEEMKKTKEGKERTGIN